VLRVYQGNRLERLAERLAEVVRDPAGGALESETILVQNQGMGRWLVLRLADELGVCANIRFPFPASFLWELFRRVLPEVPETSAFEVDVLALRVLGRLGSLHDDRDFRPLHHYLAGADDRERCELAHRIADTFDRYQVYRPDWIEAWERGGGEDAGWQARLWRDLAAEEGAVHRVAVARAFVEALRAAASRGERPDLPERACLFGIPALPPIWMDLFEAIARFVDLHLFVLNPCRQYWGEIVSDRAIARREADPEEQHLETGHSLLASLGGMGRDFIDRVIECEPKVEEEHFVEPDPGMLLGAIQADILDLAERGTEGIARSVLGPEDDSVQVHACHGPMREVEVLYDRMLDLFEGHPEITPSDVVVMTPDIETYAPYVEAVFGTVGAAQRRIPYTIADRSPRAQSPLVDVFLALVELPRSRFDANRVLALLESGAVRRRFGFAADDLASVQRWVRETGIRWGIDERTRRELDLPETREHTWRAGLERMLLGFALPGGERRLFEGILPYDEIEGREARVLGRLISFAESVFELARDARRPRPLEAWCDRLLRAFDRFFEPLEDEEPEAREIREAIRAGAEAARVARADEALSLDAALAVLRRRLERSDPVGGFLGGGVTFCAMVPMRSIPFEVVCLIGMDDARYPRARKPVGFDRMARSFRRGDRSGRDDDRYLFLEAVLSARRCLYISYVGQSIRDNNAIPPSVLVSELLDTVERGFYFADDPERSVLERLVVRHPLQAFSRRYFDGGDPRLFSFSREQCAQARRAGRGDADAVPFLTDRLPEAALEAGTVPLDDLVAFFQNPARHLLRERLGLYLRHADGLLETREPFRLEYFDGQDLREKLLAMRDEGRSLADALPIARALGVLPHGRAGETAFARELDETVRFAERLDAATAGERTLEPIDVDLPLGDLRLAGRLEHVTPGGILRWRAGAVQGRDRARLWIEHLALCAVVPHGVACRARFVHGRGVHRLEPVEDARARLERLVRLYVEGLHRPVPCFPRTSYTFALQYPRGRDTAREAAWKRWHSEGRRPEREEESYRLVYRGVDPLDAEFEELALEFYAGLLEHTAAEEPA